MKKIVMGLLLVAVSGVVWANCRSTTVSSGGTVLVCITCCDESGQNCVTTCN